MKFPDIIYQIFYDILWTESKKTNSFSFWIKPPRSIERMYLFLNENSSKYSLSYNLYLSMICTVHKFIWNKLFQIYLSFNDTFRIYLLRRFFILYPVVIFNKERERILMYAKQCNFIFTNFYKLQTDTVKLYEYFL